MSKLDKLIAELCPDGVEFVKIGDVVNYEQPAPYIVENTNYNDDFSTPVLTAGQTFILGYTNETEGIYHASTDNPVIIFDDFTSSFKWVDFPFKVKSSAVKMLKADEEKTFLRYIFYAMGSLKFKPTREHRRIWIREYAEPKIPLPPLEVQREIVRILDKFTELTQELTQELELRKIQYQYYLDKFTTFGDDVQRVLLINLVSKLVDGMHILPRELDRTGKYPVISAKNVLNGYIDMSTDKYADEETFQKENARTRVQNGDVLLTIVGTVGRTAIVSNDEKMLFQRSICIMTPDTQKIIPGFLKYLLDCPQIQRWMQKNSYGAIQRGLYLKTLKNLTLPLPPIEEQRLIVGILDRFERLCNDLTSGLPAEISARKKQYEYYRDKLLTFKQKNSGQLIVPTAEV